MARTTAYYAHPGSVELVVSEGGVRQYPWHVHRCRPVCGIVLTGAASLTTRFGETFITPAGCFFVPPGQAHALRLAQRTRLLVLCLPIGESGHGLGCPGLPLAKEILADNAERRALAKLEVFAATQTHAIGHGVPQTLEGIRQRMAAHAGQPFPLRDLAEASGYSLWHFLRIFRNFTGMPPHAYLLACRIGLARSRIRDGAALADAATEAGFADQSHLCKAFRHHHGLSPGAFRKATIRLAP